MSDIRFNRWLHQSGTGGVYQASSGNVGIGTSVPSTTLDVNGAISATSISATTGTITGNLSVGGVLTYEDVTNIDAVGVVTARAGVKVPDNQKIFLGTDNDLQVYHSGSWNYIQSHNSKNFVIQVNDSENAFVAIPDGEVLLYHNNVKKFETTSNGIQISGDQVLNGHLDMRDNDTVRLGASNDLQIFHNGSANYIDNTSDLYVRVNGSETAIYATANGKVALNYDGSNRLETTATGATISNDLVLNHASGDKAIRWATGGTNKWSLYHNNGAGALVAYDNANNAERLRLTSDGKVRLPDNGKFVSGTGDDLSIYHNGTHNFINSSGSADLYVRGANILLQDHVNSNRNWLIGLANGTLELYHSGNKKLETTNLGVKITNNLYLGGSTNGGFSYNPIADTLEFLTTNGGTHSELTHNAYVPSASGTRHLGYANKRWDTLYVDKIAFGGSANTSQHTLDDYEEGTWTPSFSGRTLSSAEGTYTKIGRQVLVRFLVAGLNSSINAGNTSINGLPFTAGNLNQNGAVYIADTSGVTYDSGYGSIYGRINGGGNGLQLLQKRNDGSTHTTAPALGTGIVLRGYAWFTV